MVELALDRTTLTLSYLWELLALPFLAGRLAAIRLAARRRHYELVQDIWREHRGLCEVIAVTRRMEQEVSQADLACQASRETALVALHAALARCKLRRGSRPGAGIIVGQARSMP